MSNRDQALVLWFSEVGKQDAELVGGKGASLGELYCELTPQGVRVPNGFTCTVSAYRNFLEAKVSTSVWKSVTCADGLESVRDAAARTESLEEALRECGKGADTEDQLEMHGRAALARALVIAAPVPAAVSAALRSGYAKLCAQYGPDVDVAVRSSATVEDSEAASFAGQCESYLNVHGADSVVYRWKQCCASLFTERAVSYQLAKGLDPLRSSVAVVVMKMVRSDLATSGVMFTLDPDSGHRGVIHVSSSYGLGELVVQGSVSCALLLVAVPCRHKRSHDIFGEPRSGIKKHEIKLSKSALCVVAVDGQQLRVHSCFRSRDTDRVIAYQRESAQHGPGAGAANVIDNPVVLSLDAEVQAPFQKEVMLSDCLASAEENLPCLDADPLAPQSGVAQSLARDTTVEAREAKESLENLLLRNLYRSTDRQQILRIVKNQHSRRHCCPDR